MVYGIREPKKGKRIRDRIEGKVLGMQMTEGLKLRR